MSHVDIRFLNSSVLCYFSFLTANESLLQEELDPLENAIQSISSKNKELADIITTFERFPESNINPLSMVLNGVIDANVNGGISKYQKVRL